MAFVRFCPWKGHPKKTICLELNGSAFFYCAEQLKLGTPNQLYDIRPFKRGVKISLDCHSVGHMYTFPMRLVIYIMAYFTLAFHWAAIIKKPNEWDSWGLDPLPPSSEEAFKGRQLPCDFGIANIPSSRLLANTMKKRTECSVLEWSEVHIYRATIRNDKLLILLQIHTSFK